jgi:carboxyl-terminal processing protease
MKDSKDYEFLKSDIEEFKKRDEEVKVSLNLVAFKAQREEEETNSLDKKNTLRVARGLNPLVKVAQQIPNEVNYDFIQEETMKILTDYIADPKIAKANMKF